MAESTKTHWDTFWLEGSKDAAPNKKIVQSIEALGDLAGWMVLEVGAGRGADSVYLARKGAESHVLDFSAKALEMTEEFARREGVNLHLIESDAHRIPFSDSYFDLIFHQGFLEHFRDPAPLLLEQKRVLKKDGFLIVDVPQKYSIYTVKKKIAIKRGTWFAGWETEYGPRQLEKLLRECGFKVENTYAWGMAESYGWKTRNLMHTIIRNSRKIRTALLKEPSQAQTGRNYNNLSTSRPLLYLATNVGVIARKT